MIVPGGFGLRGMEGKIAAARWCRENSVPYLGLCLGLQIAVIGAKPLRLKPPNALASLMPCVSRPPV